MSSAAPWWLFLNLLSIVFLAFFSMIEMACVSFNKVRLHYYVSKGVRRAQWINDLLKHPFKLFGTTLIGVNVAMVIGSECAREFHRSIGLDPDLAPISQVILVVILGELAPMFAARHYSEHVAMLGAPLLYATSKLLTPVLILLGWFSRLAELAMGSKRSTNTMFLNQEELQTILEEHGEEGPRSDTQDFNLITQNIFKLRHKTANEALRPLHAFPRLPSNATVAQMRTLVQKTNADFVLIYFKDYTNIVGISFPRDLLRAQDTRRIRDYARPPWFVTEKTSLTQILEQFQRSSQTVAIILDEEGRAKGAIALDDLIDEIFGEVKTSQLIKPKSSFIMERTFPADMKIKEFREKFNIVLDSNEELTLGELMEQLLGHVPEKGESAYLDFFELVAKETFLLEVKKITVKTIG